MSRLLLPLLLAACSRGVSDAPVDVVRVATWNVEALGAPGSDGFVATAAVLERLNADVVVLQEVRVDEGDALAALAADLGYGVVATADAVPYGDLGNAALVRLTGAEAWFPDAPTLSGDPAADDLTRRPAVVSVRLPATGRVLAVVGTHLKSGTDPDDAFRRAVDAVRTAQAAKAVGADVLVVAGDLNDDPADVDPTAGPWRAPPAEVEAWYRLGRDLTARLGEGGLPRDPFGALSEAGVEALTARQRDGTLVTRPVSGRTIDHVLGDAAVQRVRWRAEVVDPEDDALPGLADGPRPPSDAATRASDHLPVLLEIPVSGG